MNTMINQKVETPLGVVGIVQGMYRGTDEAGVVVLDGVLVRLPITAVTRAAMREARCVTPRADFHGLWVFSEDELK